jgi:hypothetical protein
MLILVDLAREVPAADKTSFAVLSDEVGPVPGCDP